MLCVLWESALAADEEPGYTLSTFQITRAQFQNILQIIDAYYIRLSNRLTSMIDSYLSNLLYYLLLVKRESFKAWNNTNNVICSEFFLTFI